MKLLGIVLLGIPLIFLLGTKLATATYGGGACTIPTAAPGATTLCTATTNGHCLIEAIDITAKTTVGICVCYSGYSGDKCQTQTTDTSTSSSSGAKNAIGALALGGLGAYLLSQLGSGGLGGGYPGNTAPGLY